MAKGTTLYYGRLWKMKGEAYQKKYPMFEQYYLLHKEQIDRELEVKPISEEKKKKVK